MSPKALELVAVDGYEAVAGEALVRFDPAVSVSTRAAAHGRALAEEVSEILPGLVLVRFEVGRLADVLESYGAESGVVFAEPNHVYRPAYLPDDEKFPSQWAPLKMRVDEVWDEQRGDASVVISVIDSGVDGDHPDLAAHFVGGIDYVGGDDDPDDLTGHGTGVAGIAAAVSDNGEGVAGIGFDCSFAMYKVGNGGFSSAFIAAAIQESILGGAHVLNMSFHDGAPSAAMELTLDQAATAGLVAVAAAGNNGNTVEQFPAAFTSVIGVANARDTDERHMSSSYGDWVSVAAPGHMIKSTAAPASYDNFFGTSMACPNVAGVAALLYAELGERSAFHAKLIANAIRQTSVPVPGDYVAHGRVDALEALRYVQDPPPPTATSLSIDAIPAWDPPKVTIEGAALDLAEAVLFAGVELGPGDFEVVSDAKLRIEPPTPIALGMQEVSVLGPGGWSDPLPLEILPTFPPVLVSTTVAVGGTPHQWTLAADAGDPYFILVSFSDATTPLGGLPALANGHVVARGFLDAAGLGQHSQVAPTGLGGTSFYSQVLVLKEGTLRPIAPSNVASTVFLF